MITPLLMMYIGYKINAPTWYFIVCGILEVYKMLEACSNVYMMRKKND